MLVGTLRVELHTWHLRTHVPFIADIQIQNPLPVCATIDTNLHSLYQL
jgi:hypothetical protein